MAKQRRSAHAELDELHRQTADARVLYRELQAQMDAANLKVEQAGAAIADAYAAENQRAVTASRKGEEEAVAEVKELQHRLTGGLLRVERAQQEADAFTRQHAKALLEERAADARELALKLTRAGHEVIRLHRAYLALRMDIDALVAHVPGALPRTDGPPASYAWEPQLRDLERAVREAPEVPALSPRWAGLAHRKQQDEQLSQHRTATPNVAGRVPS